MPQYDWLKGGNMIKIVFLPNDTDYSFCEFVAPNTPYYASVHHFSPFCTWSERFNKLSRKSFILIFLSGNTDGFRDYVVPVRSTSDLSQSSHQSAVGLPESLALVTAPLEKDIRPSGGQSVCKGKIRIYLHGPYLYCCIM